jgi:hypothetical protein
MTYYPSDLPTPLTDDLAAMVRRLRVEEAYSWRAIARQIATHLGMRDAWWAGNQPAGMSICDAAARSFGEDFTEEPWN